MIFRFGQQTHLQEKQELAIGAFDAFHKGHQALLKYLNPGCACMTLFFPLPAQVFRSDFEGSICSFAQRCELAKEFGIDHILHIDFSREFSKMLGEDFLAEVCCCMPLKKIVVGWDFCMGRNRSFSTDNLLEWGHKHGKEIVIIPEEKQGDIHFSSSAVRTAVISGEFNLPKKILGRPYCLDLRGLPSEKKGKLIMINLENSEQILPPEGEYETNAGRGQLKEKKLTLSEIVEQCEFKKKLD